MSTWTTTAAAPVLALLAENGAPARCARPWYCARPSNGSLVEVSSARQKGREKRRSDEEMVVGTSSLLSYEDDDADAHAESFKASCFAGGGCNNPGCRTTTERGQQQYSLPIRSKSKASRPPPNRARGPAYEYETPC